ncbi:MAG TPA: response regulator [Candidatus Omnitrophota bacterium]|jgi:putative two-component system response regulator|nr:response regulator [Candidatus Omnitrophota bacterium]HPN55757.1 response regulator [Candidatus Omnitrophota bacterium]
MYTKEQMDNSRILIVDDQKLHGLYLKKILAEEGFKNVEYANDSLKVLGLVRDFQPEIIVLDIFMPHLDGFQIMEQLAEFRREHYLPILALSSEKSSDVRLRALQSGATDFLNKPYENMEIIFRIHNMIEMRSLHMEVKNQNKILESKVQERTKELRETQLDIIRRLAQAAEFRDSDTGLHIIRMSQYCQKFGVAMGMSLPECDLLLHASPLHDIGKLGIPDAVLLKPGRLTQEEYEIMKTHTVIGAKLLAGSSSPVMKMAQIICITHHEKWDGTGYPKQLRGDEIPVVGQICSICDVFDALTSDRPYKQAWPVDAAVEEIRHMKETHFSPIIVDRFLEILPLIEDIRNRCVNSY